MKLLRSAWSTLSTGYSAIQSPRTGIQSDLATNATTVSGPRAPYTLSGSPGNGTTRTIYRRATLTGKALRKQTKNANTPGRPPGITSSQTCTSDHSYVHVVLAW